MLANIYKTCDEVIPRKIADEVVLMPIISSLVEEPRIFGLNSLGYFIWEKLDGKSSLEQILQEIVQNFSVNADVAQQDLHKFVAGLLQHNLITKVD